MVVVNKMVQPPHWPMPQPNWCPQLSSSRKTSEQGGGSGQHRRVWLVVDVYV